MITIFTLFCAVGIVYAYFGYPLLLWVIRRFSSVPAKPATGDALRSVSVVIAVRNEAASIAEKIENTLLAVEEARSARIETELFVASDASDDRTDEIVQGFAKSGVQLVRVPTRGGKERAQLAAIEASRGEVLIFTDAKVRFERDAVKRFAAYFTDPRVGAVSSVDRISTAETEGSGEGFYVRYEMWLRRLESELNTLIGLSGSCFAARRVIAARLQPDIPSDFVTMIEAHRAGLRGVLAEDIPCTYKSVASEAEEYGRKVRTVLRGMRAMRAYCGMLNPFRYGLFAIQLMSHKVFRWLVPWFFLGSALGSALLSSWSEFFAIMFLAHLVLVMTAVTALQNERVRKSIPGKLALFFGVSNAAIFIAWIRLFQGEQAVTWTPSEKRV